MQTRTTSRWQTAAALHEDESNERRRDATERTERKASRTTATRRAAALQRRAASDETCSNHLPQSIGKPSAKMSYEEGNEQAKRWNRQPNDCAHQRRTTTRWRREWQKRWKTTTIAALQTERMMLTRSPSKSMAQLQQRPTTIRWRTSLLRRCPVLRPRLRICCLSLLHRRTFLLLPLQCSIREFDVSLVVCRSSRATHCRPHRLH